MPSFSDALHQKMLAAHLYTVYDLANTPVESLEKIFMISSAEAERLRGEAADALDLLRRRSDCRKFVRSILPPRRGRSPAGVIRKLHEAGINDIESLGLVDRSVLRQAGVGEKEAESLQAEAKKVAGERRLKETGLPAVSLKKYIEAGFSRPEDLLSAHPLYISSRTGISPETVYRHIGKVASALGRPVPEKVSSAQYEKGRREILGIRGVTESTREALLRAGVYNLETLHEIDESTISCRSGLPRERVRELRSAAPFKKKKKQSDDIIVI